MKKTLLEMKNPELFAVLAGSENVMMKMYLEKAIKWYREKYGVEKVEDLEKVVLAYSQED
ncbi:MAG: hypothetical protein IIZ39_02155 [Blautia sp.]|nr:hypothetical protein [Blautia sp.]